MSFPGNALNRLNTTGAVGWLKYRVKAGADSRTWAPAPRCCGESTRYEEESLRGSVKLSLNSRRVLARFRPPRLHNGGIYVQRGPIKIKTFRGGRVFSPGAFTTVRINNAAVWRNFSFYIALSLFKHSSSRVLCRSNKDWWREARWY